LYFFCEIENQHACACPQKCSNKSLKLDNISNILNHLGARQDATKKSSLSCKIIDGKFNFSVIFHAINQIIQDFQFLFFKIINSCFSELFSSKFYITSSNASETVFCLC